MSKEISKDELENQFQAFLRQSGSSEDSAFEVSSKKKKKAEANLWWLDDSDKEDEAKTGEGSKSGGKSFLKSKKPVTESIKTDEDELLQDETSPKLKKANTDKARTRNKLEVSPKRTRSRPEASMSKDSLEDISEKSEEHEPDGKRSAVRESRAVEEESRAVKYESETFIPDSSLDATKDSYTTEAATDRQDDVNRFGMDTIEENAEKQKFFNDLEGNGTVDYSRLNQEMSRTEFGLSPGGAAKIVDLLDETQEEPEEDVIKPFSADKDSLQVKPSMLSKVSLLDSLDSTLNTTTSPKASMPGQKSRDGEIGDHDNGADLIKTQTGTGIGTNTSKEIEALNEALREVGMSTTYNPDGDILSEFMSKNGNATTNDSDPAQPSTSTQMPGKPNSGKERNVGDILQEMEELKKKVKQKEDELGDVRLISDYKSPHSPSPDSSSRRLQRQSRMDDDQKQGGFDHSHTDDTEVYQPVTAVGNARHMSYMRSLPEKKNKTSFDDSEATISSKPRPVKKSKSKTKMHKVQSSGYGRRSGGTSPARTSPARTSQTRASTAGAFTAGVSSKSPATKVPSKTPPSQRSKKQIWSPAEVAKQKIKGTEAPPIQQEPGQQIVESQLMQSVESFAQYIKHHFTGVDMPEVKQSKEEPSMSSSMSVFDKMSHSEKDRVMMQELDALRKQLQEEREHGVKLQENISAMGELYHKEMESLRIEHDQELFQLKQENFVQAAKLSEGTSEPRRRIIETTDLSKETAEMFEKEIKEQELLLAGYQEENRKLYDESKNLKKTTKLTEEKMFEENQKLISQIGFLKSQLEEKDDQLRNKGVITSVAAQQQIAIGNSDMAISEDKIVQLDAELKETKKREESLLRDLKEVQETKAELDKRIDEVLIESESLHKDLDEANKRKPKQIKQLEKKHKEEVDQLQKKLEWYIENQELLEKDVITIKKHEETIVLLKTRVEDLQTQAGKRLAENKIRSRERAEDAKKVIDYQRQVKEMEKIIKLRYPNSLPALMLTAANAAEAAPKPLVEVLEKQIRHKEHELENKDEQANCMLRSMEQRYNVLKLQYDNKVAYLEQELEGYTELKEQNKKEEESNVGLRRQLEDVALELQYVKERNVGISRQLEDVTYATKRGEEKIAKLKRQLEEQRIILEREGSSHYTVVVSSESDSSEQIILNMDDKAVYQAVQVLKADEQQMKEEIKEKNAELKRLNYSVERLNREKHVFMMRALSSDHNQSASKEPLKSRSKSKLSKKKQEENKVNGDVQRGRIKNREGNRVNHGVQTEHSTNRDNEVQTESFTKAYDGDRLNSKAQKPSRQKQDGNKVQFKEEEIQKDYEPDPFVDSHMYDVLLENEELKLRMNDLLLAFDEQRVDLSKSLAESEFCVRRTREDCENKIKALRASHQQQLQKLLNEQALEEYTSEVAKLQSKCDTQEVMIKHLQKQLAKCSDDAEQISALKIQLEVQKSQIEKLQELLFEAKQNRTPEMKHFAYVEEKVTALESRHLQREQELQQIIHNSQQVASVELSKEVEKWKSLVDTKNHEIQRFRAELDSILNVLRSLQKQGVVLPFSP